MLLEYVMIKAVLSISGGTKLIHIKGSHYSEIYVPLMSN